MTNIKRIIIIIFLFLFYILFSIVSYANNTSSQISESVFRLHVIANSNSQEDQNLKYLVRDNLIAYMNSISSTISTKKEAIDLINKNINEFYCIAQKTIEDNGGYNYNINIQVGNFPFPTKKYGDISLPAGFYDALKVEIGEAKGVNWWCVMFPSLCFVDVSNGILPEETKKDLETSINKENYYLISSNDKTYKLKFKLVELFENAKIVIANKENKSNLLF